MEPKVRRALSLAAFFIAAGLPPAGGFAASAAEVPTITLGHVGHDHQIALYVAADAGKALEERYGVSLIPLKDREVYELFDGGRKVAQLNLVLVGGGSGMPAALEQGSIEVGLGGIGPIAKYADNGSPFRVLAPLNNNGDALLLRPDVPATSWAEFVAIAKKSGQPLKIGYKAPMAVAYMILTKALKEEGLTFGQEPVDKEGRAVQVLTVNLQEDQNMLPAMEAKTVDGVVANEPYPSLLEHKGLGRRVADLSTLPPQGKWEGHPCCVVAASQKALAEKRPAIVSLLKAILAGTDLMARDPEAAYRAEARWTKTPPEVARRSVPQVSYVGRPDARWQEAVKTWLELMASMNRFDKSFKGLAPEQVRAALVDLGPVTEALAAIEPKLQP
jgi:NitT/TauT family transport system substrate-binding protein